MRGGALARAVMTGVLALSAGCGGSRHPDTGAGAGETAPAAVSCVDLCQRLGECVVVLCDEDTHSTQFAGFEYLLADQCASTCTDSQISGKLTPAQWSCVFQSSCREVFDYDDCHMDGYYYCH